MPDEPTPPIPSITIDPATMAGLTPGAQAVTTAIANLINARKQLTVLILPSSGIRLKVKAIPRATLERAMAGLKALEPKPPQWTNPTTGKEEGNPNSPAYLEAVEAWNNDVITRATKIFIASGTTLESVPEGYFRPEEPGWVDELEVVGLDVSAIPPHPYPNRPPDYVHPARYLSWAELYAFRDELDMTFLFMQSREVMGTKEETVAQAMEYFWRDAQRRVGLDPGAAGPGGDGDIVGAPDPA